MEWTSLCSRAGDCAYGEKKERLELTWTSWGRAEVVELSTGVVVTLAGVTSVHEETVVHSIGSYQNAQCRSMLLQVFARGRKNDWSRQGVRCDQKVACPVALSRG